MRQVPNSGKMEIKNIKSASEIQGVTNFVLVQLGSENKSIRHGSGITYIVDKAMSDHLEGMPFEDQIERAKAFAAEQRIPTVFVLRN